MMRGKALLFSAAALVALCMLSIVVRAQTATVLDPGRRIDWSNAGVTGGIPPRTTVCSTLSPGATAAQINSAIANCPAGQIVRLNAGTYNLGGGLVFGRSDVTLRGAGPDKTHLVFTGTVSCHVGETDVCVKSGHGIYPLPPDFSANWTAGYSKGTTSITLSNTTGLAPGYLLVLDQLNDSDTDNGQIWQCENYGVCAIEGPSGLSRPSRAQLQVVTVTGVSGNTVTFTPGLYMANWRPDRSPGAWWTNAQPIQRVGLEDLSMDHTNSGQRSGVFMTNARDCWLKNVRGINSDRATVWAYGVSRITIRDSYFYGTQHAQSQSYGIETDMSSDLLVENNIFEHMALGMPTGEAVTGSVYGYNFSIDDYYVVGGNTSWMQASSYHHSAGINFNLFEGNDGIGFTADAIHGTSHFMTAFRNYWIGWETGKTQQTNAVNVYAFNRYFNFIGNVLGKPGFHTNYECFPTSPTTPDCLNGPSRSIFMIGWSGNEGKNAAVNNDLLVRSTLMRWGNYDVATGSARFNASEVPSGLSLYRNPVPANSALPASLYLASKPTWWGTIPWPAIGPDVSGGQLVNGFVHKIPARLCYENSAKLNGILTFNASTCYGNTQVSAPTAPSNVRIIR
jgi:hypothetical protein